MILIASPALRRSASLLGGVLVALLGAFTPAATTPLAVFPTTTDTTEIGQGHADIGPVLVDGQWRIEIKDDTERETVWRDPDDTVLRVHDAAEHELPDSAEYTFLGEPGAEVFLIPQTQLDGVIWLGWNTQHPTVLDDPPQQISFRIHDVTGPGRLHVFFDYGGFRPAQEVWEDTDAGEPLLVEPNTHAHANWAFTAAGEYRVGFTAEIIDKTGISHTASATLHFLVGDDTTSVAQPPLPLPLILGIVFTGLLLIAVVFVIVVRRASRA